MFGGGPYLPIQDPEQLEEAKRDGARRRHDAATKTPRIDRAITLIIVMALIAWLAAFLTHHPHR